MISIFTVHVETKEISDWIRPYTSEGKFNEEIQLMDIFFNCTTIEDCSFNGICAPSGEFCVCNRRFATFQSDDNLQCNYERKSQLVALLLHIFFGNGFAHFYIDRIGEGLALFFIVGDGTIVLMGCFACIVMYCLVNDISIGKCGMCLSCIWSTVAFSIYIWLIVIIAQNKLTDSNGVALNPI